MRTREMGRGGMETVSVEAVVSGTGGGGRVAVGVGRGKMAVSVGAEGEAEAGLQAPISNESRIKKRSCRSIKGDVIRSCRDIFRV
jgi:hypothetical protein